MSLFSKIGKGLKTLKKKITLKKTLAVGAGVAALAVPGVGGAVIAGVKGAGALIGRGGAAAGRIGKATGGAISEAAGGLAGGVTDLSNEAVELAGSLKESRQKVLDAIKRGTAAVGDFQASGKAAATEGAIAGALGAIPPLVWIGVAGIVVLLLVRKK